MRASKFSLKVGLVLLTATSRLAGCSAGEPAADTAPNRDSVQQVNNKVDSPPAKTNDALAEADLRLRHLCASASSIFKINYPDSIRMYKPSHSEPVTSDRFNDLLGDKNLSDRRLAVVIVPGYEMVGCPEMRTEEEVEVEVNEQLQKAGFKRIVFLTHINGFLLTEAYPDGLPTREELRRHKEFIQKRYGYALSTTEKEIVSGLEDAPMDRSRNRANELVLETSGRLSDLWNSASAVFEFDPQLSVKLVRPSSSQPVTIAGIGDLLREKKVRGRQLAVLKVWYESPVEPEMESQEEVMIKTAQQLRKLGFSRVLVVTQRAFLFPVGFDDELRTLEEAHRDRISAPKWKPQATSSTTNNANIAK